MKERIRGTVLSLTLVLAAGLGACGGGEEGPPAGDVHGAMPTGDTGHGGMPMGDTGHAGMRQAMGSMQRHALEADSAAQALRSHIERMRALSPDQWHARMGEHVQHVSGMLGLMQRQMREMDMGMGMSDEQMGAMMGMSAEEHRAMMDSMAALRADAEALQTASREEVRRRMPEHLDRVEAMAEVMERSAEHMRGS